MFLSHSVARISGFTFSFLALALLFGSISGLGFSLRVTGVTLALAIFFGALAFIQAANRIANYLPSPFNTAVHWVHAMTFEAFAVLTSLLLRPTHFLPSHKKSLGPQTGRPVLLVHGYLHDSSAWTYMKRSLVKEGFGPVYCLNLGHPFRSIRSYAEKIKKKTEEIEEETKRRDLILIGHSMGGLVSSFYAMHLAPLEKRIDMVTIGSPLGGTHVARIGLGPNAREMQLGSWLIEDLQIKIKKNRHIRFYHIGTKTDQLVIPHTSSFIESSIQKQFIFEDMGHVSLLFSPRVARVIQIWLKEPVAKPQFLPKSALLP